MNKVCKTQNYYFIILILLSLFYCPLHKIYAQEYPEMKIIFKNGMTLIGKDGVVSKESVSLKINKIKKTYNLDELQMVMVKKGLAKKYAMIGCAGCGGISLIAIISSKSEGSSSRYDNMAVLGALIWMGISAGTGYLIGNISDDWNTVYMSPRESSLFNNFRLSFDSMHDGELRVGLLYTF